MPYNKDLDARLQTLVSDWDNLYRKKMFGGTGYLLNGNMCCGVYRDFLILRLGESRGEAALKSPHVKPMDITGKPMKGRMMVAPEGYDSESELRHWLDEAKSFVDTLPPKK